jgi:hypothetical protein
VNLDHLPGGDDCRFQLIASTILQTAVAETPRFRVPHKPRQTSVVAMSSSGPSHSGKLVELFGVARSPDGAAEDGELLWRSNLQGILGKGSHLMRHDLIPGRHQIRLVAPDGIGGQASATTVIDVDQQAEH